MQGAGSAFAHCHRCPPLPAQIQGGCLAPKGPQAPCSVHQHSPASLTFLYGAFQGFSSSLVNFSRCSTTQLGGSLWLVH